MRRLLILGSRIRDVESQINEGDKALSIGFHKLVDKFWEGHVELADWKPFADINFKMLERVYLQTSTAETSWETISNKILAKYRNGKPENGIIHRVCKVLFNSILFARLDKWFKKRFSIGLSFYLERKLFPSHFAHRFIEMVKESDLIVMNGAGLLGDHIKDHSIRILFEAYLCTKLRKKISILNYTAYASESTFKELVDFVLKRVDLHFVRESKSGEFLLKQGISSDKIRVVPDTAFTIFNGEVKNSVKRESLEHKIIFLTIRGDRKVKFNWWVKTIEELRKDSCKIVFIHSCYAHDRKVSSKLFSMGLLDKDINPNGFEEYIQILMNGFCVITDRYHPVIFSTLAELPFIPFSSTTHKTDGICQMLNYPLAVINYSNPHHQVMENVDYIAKNRNELVVSLKQTKAKFINKIHSEYSNLFKLYFGGDPNELRNE